VKVDPVEEVEEVKERVPLIMEKQVLQILEVVVEQEQDLLEVLMVVQV
jgi:hypothetical protein